MTYNIDRLKADLERAGVNLTVRSLNHFQNFNEAGCEIAIDWLLSNAPWTDKDTDAVAHKAKYVDLILDTPDQATVDSSQRLYSEDYGVWYYPLKWLKQDGGYYSSPIQADDKDLSNPKECYHVTVEKINPSKWVIFAEENEPSDFEKSVFRTLKEAKEFLQDWALQWISCEMHLLDEE